MHIQQRSFLKVRPVKILAFNVEWAGILCCSFALDNFLHMKQHLWSTSINFVLELLVAQDYYFILLSYHNIFKIKRIHFVQTAVITLTICRYYKIVNNSLSACTWVKQQMLQSSSIIFCLRSCCIWDICSSSSSKVCTIIMFLKCNNHERYLL